MGKGKPYFSRLLLLLPLLCQYSRVWAPSEQIQVPLCFPHLYIHIGSRPALAKTPSMEGHHFAFPTCPQIHRGQVWLSVAQLWGLDRSNAGFPHLYKGSVMDEVGGEHHFSCLTSSLPPRYIGVVLCCLDHMVGRSSCNKNSWRGGGFS